MRSLNVVVAIQNDKDAGVSLLSAHEHRVVAQELLADSMCRVQLPCLALGSSDEYSSLRAAVEEATCDEGIGWRLRSTNRDRSTIVASFLTLCKTQKDPGEVSHRNVHRMPCFAYASLSK